MAEERTETLSDATARLSALRVTAEEDNDDALARTRTEARVDEIVNAMCGGAWVTGSSHRQFAALWGCSMARVEVYAAEANRVIRRWLREGPEDKKETLARLVQNLERIAQKAEKRGSAKGYRDAIEAYRMLAQLHGVLKHQIEMEDGASPFTGWTREEKERFVETGQRPERIAPRGDAGQ